MRKSVRENRYEKVGTRKSVRERRYEYEKGGTRKSVRERRYKKDGTKVVTRKTVRKSLREGRYENVDPIGFLLLW